MENFFLFFFLNSLIACVYSAGFIFWKWKPDDKISFLLFLVIVSIAIFLIFLFIRFTINLYENRKQNCVVLQIRESYGNYKIENSVILLTTYVEYFTENGIVSIFHLENGFERQIALGRILNIQEDKKVQIQAFDIDSDFSCEKLMKNEPDLREKLRVKPIIKIAISP